MWRPPRTTAAHRRRAGRRRRPRLDRCRPDGRRTPRTRPPPATSCYRARRPRRKARAGRSARPPRPGARRPGARGRRVRHPPDPAARRGGRPTARRHPASSSTGASRQDRATPASPARSPARSAARPAAWSARQAAVPRCSRSRRVARRARRIPPSPGTCARRPRPRPPDPVQPGSLRGARRTPGASRIGWRKRSRSLQARSSATPGTLSTSYHHTPDRASADVPDRLAGRGHRAARARARPVSRGTGSRCQT